MRFIVLDTTNPNGLQHGSLDKAQFAWLQKLLTKSTDKYVVLASHHTIGTMRKKDAPSTGIKDRVFGPKVRKELLKHRNVILWVNGHTHTNHIWPHAYKNKAGQTTGRGFWEVNTASHIDWPQQSRIVEIVDNKDGTLSIFTTMVDHGAPLEFTGDLTDPMQLAALGRELAANDWQEQSRDRRGARQGPQRRAGGEEAEAGLTRPRWRPAGRRLRRSRGRGCRGPWSGCPWPRAGGRTRARRPGRTRSTWSPASG